MTHEVNDLSLEELEGDRWGEPPPGSTFLITRVTQLRRVPVGSLDTEGLRIMIGQGVGLPVLIPRALAVLRRDPLAHGDFYPGDLLAAVVRKYDDWKSTVDDPEGELRRIVHAIDVEDADVMPDLLAELAPFIADPD
ncbi:contact-dependent growth inhibition system immunity protein [Actinotalea sp. JY-7885]|uniref:contact-dependent growth inhibition system immunity protein n=1 Tax=Actinotalea sp. JY-7885 TaxID=2758576 RepID=UPI001CB6C90E|nr:contact-dependent growth inhibition system immunity protein [Actinotalea sp. JY-7885]